MHKRGSKRKAGGEASTQGKLEERKQHKEGIETEGIRGKMRRGMAGTLSTMRGGCKKRG